MHIPSSTYRIQLHNGFTLKDLQRITEYLHALGISTVYASPVMQAAPGSMHGYDVTDPHTINTEIGTVDDLYALAQDLRKKNMCWLQDIVPNHMAFHPMNSRLMDVMERGPQSPYYRYFDIDWNHPSPDLDGKLMVPFLGDEAEACMQRGEIKLAFSETGFRFDYLETHYPLSVSAYPLLAARANDSGIQSLATILSRMVVGADAVDVETWSNLKKEFVAAIQDDPANVEAAKHLVDAINADKAALKALADTQYYRLAYWKNTEKEINYRRFFTVNELICLRMEDEGVFDEYHAYLSKLLKEKVIQGLRIDHIDGLYDPAGYAQQLRSLAGDGCYIIAEKILEAREDMPARWPLEGTSGYEFLSLLNQLLTLRKGAKQLRAFYHELLPDMPSYDALIFDSKRLILQNYMCGEWNNLTNLFQSLKLGDDIPKERIRQALGLFMLSLPVYRIYPDSLPLKGKSLATVQEAFEKASKEGSDYQQELDHLRNLFTSIQTEERSKRILAFLRRVMQFTGPLTAKGVEDTTFYIYNPLISHDEVGDSPAPLGMSIQRFHEKMLTRQSNTPLSLNATATHDTKRGEDSRIRINVLSRIPDLWREHVTQWLAMNKSLRTTINGRTVPELNDEYFIYQSLLGGLPEDLNITDDWIQRVEAYLNKALREAKVNTSWSEPDDDYEKGCEKFLEAIVKKDSPFMTSFIPFAKTVLDHAMVYSLSQTLLKLTTPGIPDIYQGCELWDLSFVDPDNRRPVDFEKRMEYLFQLVLKEQKGDQSLLEYVGQHRQSGLEKLYLIWKVLNFRKKNPLLFTEGEYLPLAVTGQEPSAMAFARSYRDKWIVVAIPMGLVKHDTLPAQDSSQFLILPEHAPTQWTQLLTGESYTSPNQLPIAEIFKDFPVALLHSS